VNQLKSELAEGVSRLNVESLKPDLEHPISRRLAILREWEKDGIPEGQSLPTSLNQVRTWNAPELGILPIGSAGDFTKTNSDHGKSIMRISS
jgi:hypothetical protein